MKRKPRKGIIILGILVLLFGLYNLIWYGIISSTYGKFTTGMVELYPHRTYVIDDKDGYTYNVKFPNYLSYTGNLGIQPSHDSDCALIIWPGIGRETTYGVLISTGDGRSQGITLTEERIPAADVPPQIKQIFEENSDKINNLFIKASIQWDFLT